MLVTEVGPSENLDLNLHGTQVLGAIAGLTKGVAPNVTPVLFQLDLQSDNKYTIEALDRILFDWNNKKAGGFPTPMAVLNIAMGFARQDRPEFVVALTERMRAIVAANILPVAALGNSNLVSGIKVRVNQKTH